MMEKCSIYKIDCENITQSVTIVPRLEYSNMLLTQIVDSLCEKRNQLKKLNREILKKSSETDEIFLKSVNLEQTLAFCLEILSQMQKKIGLVNGITSIPIILPSTIPIIRTISAQLFDILPESSQNLCELSVHLGSIVLDSATLTEAKFDFGQSNTESSQFLDEVKLMVDSKISKQYPNLDFFKGHNT